MYSDHRVTLFTAMKCQEWDKVMTMLNSNNGKSFLQLEDGTRRSSPLHLAVYFGNEKVVKKLLDLGADITKFESGCGNRTLLHIAAEEGHLEVLSILLNHCDSSYLNEIKIQPGKNPREIADLTKHVRCSHALSNFFPSREDVFSNYQHAVSALAEEYIKVKESTFNASSTGIELAQQELRFPVGRLYGAVLFGNFRKLPSNIPTDTLQLIIKSDCGRSMTYTSSVNNSVYGIDITHQNTFCSIALCRTDFWSTQLSRIDYNIGNQPDWYPLPGLGGTELYIASAVHSKPDFVMRHTPPRVVFSKVRIVIDKAMYLEKCSNVVQTYDPDAYVEISGLHGPPRTTSIQRSSCNPKWNEVIEVLVSDETRVEISIFHSSLLGADRLLGSCELPDLPRGDEELSIGSGAVLRIVWSRDDISNKKTVPCNVWVHKTGESIDVENEKDEQLTWSPVSTSTSSSPLASGEVVTPKNRCYRKRLSSVNLRSD